MADHSPIRRAPHRLLGAVCHGPVGGRHVISARTHLIRAVAFGVAALLFGATTAMLAIAVFGHLDDLTASLVVRLGTLVFTLGVTAAFVALMPTPRKLRGQGERLSPGARR